MKPILTVPLIDLINDIYSINAEEYLDVERYQLNTIDDTTPDKYDVNYFNKVYTKVKSPERVGDENVIDIIQWAKHYRYTETYPQDVYDNVLKYAIESIESDFKDADSSVMYDDIQFDINSFDDESDQENSVKRQHEIIKNKVTVKYNDDTKEVEFYGSLEKLAFIVIAAVHGYGMFRFSSLEEFCDLGEGESIPTEVLQKTIIDHMHWLNRWNDIYGDGTFTLSESNIANRLNYNYSLGNYDYTTEHVELALEHIDNMQAYRM